jgi:O-antigen biosynthesis protein
VCGNARQLYFDPRQRAAWLYKYPANRRPWVAGNSFAYTRETWLRSPFDEVAVGEDTRFLWNGATPRLHALEDHRLVVGLVHATNTSRKNTGDPWWRPLPFAEIEAVLGDDAARYAGS